MDNEENVVPTPMGESEGTGETPSTEGVEGTEEETPVVEDMSGNEGADQV